MTKKESLKLFIAEHKVGLAVMATTVICGVATSAILIARAGQWNTFLTEHNLMEEFYTED